MSEYTCYAGETEVVTVVYVESGCYLPAAYHRHLQETAKDCGRGQTISSGLCATVEEDTQREGSRFADDGEECLDALEAEVGGHLLEVVVNRHPVGSWSASKGYRRMRQIWSESGRVCAVDGTVQAGYQSV